MQSSGGMLLALLFSLLSIAAVPHDKRTILTSGDKVYTIHYQLGQSTVLYFGMKPETVICGNKNYFVIEKIKEGVTIQPLGNFSTNLTVMSQGKRFLFYLTPAKGGAFDSFIDVRWIPEQEARSVAGLGGQTTQSVRELSGRASLGTIELNLKREIRIEAAKRSILEFEVKNSGRTPVKVTEMEAVLLRSTQPLTHQVSVFEQEELKPGASTRGRVIVTGSSLKGAALVVSRSGKSAKLQLLGGSH